ncbi:hypothetical protein [Saccharothrix lopnurensis]|uniref:Secreted protein with PEP-CTERM sorting signal n=1 Tax=Saccharothrix lopnurensis TaxID=1670621 RepID=A0ABW1NXM3_9PSEU
MKRLLLGAFWLVLLVLAVVFRDEAPGALPAVLAGGLVLLGAGTVMRAVEKRKNRSPDR